MKKTLTLRPLSERIDTPRLQKKGRGWSIAESRLDAIHENARAAKRSQTPAQVALGEALKDANLGKYRLRSQTVIGSAIVDFACQPLKVVVLIDEPGANAELSQRRDRSLTEVGMKVLRVSAEAVLEDVEGVTAGIVAALKARWSEQRMRPSPRGGASGGYRR